MGRKLARLAGRLGCLAMSSYVARPHVLADQFVPGYLGDSFGLFPFVHGDPLANQFDGPFLIRLIGEEVTLPGFPSESKVVTRTFPSCWHSGTMRRSPNENASRGSKNTGRHSCVKLLPPVEAPRIKNL
jgi:hypothetical protein